MAKDIISVKCPCCKSVLEVDVEAERVTAHRKGAHLREDARNNEDALDVALRNHTESKSKIEDDFMKAQHRVKNSSSELDALLRKAQEDAKKHKDDPNNPFSGGKKIWD